MDVVYYVPYEYSAKIYRLNQYKIYRARINKRVKSSMFDIEFILSLIFDSDETNVVASNDEVFASYKEAQDWAKNKRECLK